MRCAIPVAAGIRASASVIALYAERMSRLPLTRRTAHHSNHKRNADALTRLVEDLLDVSSIITGKLTLDARPLVKFTGSGGTITVTVTHSGDAVTTSESDTGVGIRREVLPFVFDRFRQADASTTRAQRGPGLAIVRHIVESHAGNVKAHSVEGKGTTLEVQLPAIEPIAEGPWCDWRTLRFSTLLVPCWSAFAC